VVGGVAGACVNLVLVGQVCGAGYHSNKPRSAAGTFTWVAT
jgi:hypothetical protein